MRPAGRKNIPGKPIQYATTENFLNHFNIQKLSDLPTIEELGSAGLIDASSVNSSIFGTGKFFLSNHQKQLMMISLMKNPLQLMGKITQNKVIYLI